MKRENIAHFTSQSVWGMIGLTIVTLTFYFPFWLRKTSRIVNDLLPTNRIGAGFFPISIMLTIINFGMVIPEIMSNDDQTVVMMSKLVNLLDVLVILVWSFKIRNRINMILEAENPSRLWFNAVWTFLFQLFYIQFRINRIKKAEQPAGGDA